MKITALDIRRKEFKRSVRGYLDEEVDVFLDAVANEFERFSQENAELQERLRVLEEQVAGHTHIREALEKTLVAAQLQSEEIRSNAEKESRSMLLDAEAKAKNVVSELYAQTQKVQQTLMQLKLIEEDFRFKFRALLEGYLKLLDEGPVLLSGLETRLAADLDSRVEAAPGPTTGGPAAVEGRPSVGQRVEDNPTLETEEVSTLRVDLEADGGAGPGATEGQAPPQAAKQSAASVEETTEEFTVDASSPQTRTEEASKAQAKNAAEGGSGGGVSLGRQADDPDDPFPGDDTRPAKVRDFEW